MRARISNERRITPTAAAHPPPHRCGTSRIFLQSLRLPRSWPASPSPVLSRLRLHRRRRRVLELEAVSRPVNAALTTRPLIQEWRPWHLAGDKDQPAVAATFSPIICYSCLFRSRRRWQRQGARPRLIVLPGVRLFVAQSG
jgi:hypothetical protein